MTPPQIRTLWFVVVTLSAFAASWVAFDAWTYRVHKNPSTISYVLAIVARDWPIVAFAFGFVTTMLAVHFFLPVVHDAQRRDLPALFAWAVGSLMGAVAAYLFWRQGRCGPDAEGPRDAAS